MSVKVNRNSRLRLGEFVSQDGVAFWDALQLPSIPPYPEDEVHTIRPQERLDQLAYRFYGDSTLWWVLALANEMELIPRDLKVGSQIRVPAPHRVRHDILGE